MTTNKAPGFCSCENKGFQMTFANGYTVSVQFGPGSYCEKGRSTAYNEPKLTDYWKSGNAEMAAWDASDKWYAKEGWGDDVKGYSTSDEVAAFIEEVSKLPGVSL